MTWEMCQLSDHAFSTESQTGSYTFFKMPERNIFRGISLVEPVQRLRCKDSGASNCQGVLRNGEIWSNMGSITHLFCPSVHRANHAAFFLQHATFTHVELLCQVSISDTLKVAEGI